MSNQSYITLYEDEVRSVSLAIRDQDDVVWTPTLAYFQVVDEDGDTVSAEVSGAISTNVVTAEITTTVTATPGTYFIIWRVLDSTGHTFYHKTRLVVEEL